MCGISGLLRLDGDDCARPDAVRRMIGRIRHRGPDGEGYWHEGPVALGHCRLAIRDLTDAGAQPFHSRDGGVVISYNGEIYNHVEIARDLEAASGFTRRTDCDTELIPEAYRQWGLEAFGRFEGMFAIALWDRAARRLVLARDGVGIKPLYIWEGPREIVFGSEIKAVLAGLETRPALSAPDLAHMLALGYPAPDRSLVTGLRQLAPGTVLVVEGAVQRELRFWRPRRIPIGIGAAEAAERFAAIFKEVVADQLVADVPVGVMQSGGIDSSLVSLALPRDRDIPLFSVRFGERSHDESRLAAQVADAGGRRVTWVDLGLGGDLVDDFRAAVTAVDGHLADSSLLASFMLSRALAGRVKVALSGDGADEFFGGYPTYNASRAAGLVRRLLPAAAWRQVAGLAEVWAGVSERRIARGEVLYRLLAGLGHTAPHAAWRHYLPRWRQAGLYGPALAAERDRDPFAAYAAAMAGGSDLVDRCLLADQSYYLPADMLVKVDRASMAHALEVRVPFLDRRIMDFAATIPHDLMIGRGGATKSVLRTALAGLGAPADVVRGRKKGFNVPMNALLKGGLRGEAERLLDREAGVFAPYLAPDSVRAVWRAHDAGERDGKYVVWTLLTLGTWLEKGEVA